MSALQLGFFPLLGVSVTDAFEPDSQGIIHPYPLGGLNHGVCACGMKQINGKWYLLMPNSWGLKWGVNGIAWFPVECLPPQVPAWCVRAPTTPRNDPMFARAATKEKAREMAVAA